MTFRCELTGRCAGTGNNVSNSCAKTRRRWMPNIQSHVFYSDILGNSYGLRVSARAIRTVDKYRGLDAFMQKAKADCMSEKAKRIRNNILKKIKEKSLETSTVEEESKETA